MTAFNRILQTAADRQRVIVLPEATDSRVLAAAAEAVSRSLARIVLIGEPDTVKTEMEALDLSADGISIVDHQTDEHRSTYINRLVELRQHRGMNAASAESAMQDPFIFASMMLDAGHADGCVAGAITKTADVVRGAMQLVGKRDDVKQVSSFFIMRLQDHHPVDDVMVIADCALVIDPNAEELASLAADTGDSAHQLLGFEPQIAMLSFSTEGSANHAHVQKVATATELLRKQRPQWRVVGEVQLDAAVIPSILQSKSPTQATDEPCNTLIFPNLDAGNIGYKLIERFGGAQAIGPILQGLKKPVNDLSRGCSQSDIVNLIAVTSAQCENP